MARLDFFVSLAIVFASIPSGLAGPACAKRHRKAADCVARCQSNWGWTGAMMGTDPWGSVIKKVDTPQAWSSVISKACGTETTTPALAIATTSSTPSPTSVAVVTTSSSARIAETTSTSVSSTTKSSSSAVATITGVIDLVPTTSKPAPPPPASTPPPAPKTTPPPLPALPPPPPPPKNNPAPPPPPPANSGSGGTSASDIQAYLSGHNAARAQHGAPPLSWNDDLAGKAQQWANGCQFKHSGGTLGRLGENLAAGTGDSYGIAAAIKSWTDEAPQYNPNNPQSSHFTQVVWKDTNQVGCAVKSCNGIFDAKFGLAKMYVCEYSNPGNVVGHFAANVLV